VKQGDDRAWPAGAHCGCGFAAGAFIDALPKSILKKIQFKNCLPE
jgi:hypothetical protein